MRKNIQYSQSNFKSCLPGNPLIKLMVIVLLSISIIIGCSQIRKVTYPQGYVYLEKKEVRSKMALLGFYVRQMDEILYREDSVSHQDQARLLELLSLINKTTSDLHASNRDTNHLVIDEHMDQFKSDVLSAIRGAKENPPNYFAAGQISGSCTACHKFRKPNRSPG